ncbi:MAG: hypothetical protein ABEI13_03280 [Candidatus Paceibacteria bacterium]
MTHIKHLPPHPDRFVDEWLDIEISEEKYSTGGGHARYIPVESLKEIGAIVLSHEDDDE